MPKPNFLGIGAQRAGTTFLHLALSRHPQIAMPRAGRDAWNKEQHFFNKYLLASDLDEYEQHFVDNDKHDVRRAGEITPAYSSLPAYLVKTVERYLPRESTLILFVIRHPVARVLSNYRMFRKKRENHSRYDGLRSLWRFILYAENPGVVYRTDYCRTMNNWKSAYGAENILVISFDELTSDPVRCLQRIARFLDVDPEFFGPGTIPAGRIHESPEDEVPGIAGKYLAWRWLPCVRRLDRETQCEVAEWIRQMEIDAKRITFPMRLLFSVAKPTAWAWNASKRHRLKRRFRKLDARLKHLVESRA